jgi:UDP-N-acetylglucosamine acyltransferase
VASRKAPKKVAGKKSPRKTSSRETRNPKRETIHATAVIHAGAKLHPSAKIGPYCVIGAGVELGDGCELMSHVVIHGPATIGKHNRFFPFSAVGTEPQDVTYKGESTRLRMGDHNVVREFVTINRGTKKGGGTTRIGSHCLIMAYSHVGHDCSVGDHVMMVNGATLAGHVTVEEWAVVGAISPVHQFVRVGAHAYLGGGTITTQDVMPFSKTSAARDNHAYGLNSVGLERRGFSKDRIQKLQRAYRVLLASKLNTSQALEKLKSEADLGEDVEYLIKFIESSERGVIK